MSATTTNKATPLTQHPVQRPETASRSPPPRRRTSPPRHSLRRQVLLQAPCWRIKFSYRNIREEWIQKKGGARGTLYENSILHAWVCAECKSTNLLPLAAVASIGQQHQQHPACMLVHGYRFVHACMPAVADAFVCAACILAGVDTIHTK